MNKIKAIIAPVIEEVGKFAETAKEQVVLADQPQQANNDTKKLVEDIYKPGEVKSPAEIAQNKAKDQAKLAKTRAKLSAHQQYFQRLTNPPKAPEESKAEEKDREEDKKRWELQEDKKEKRKFIPIDRAQNIEKHRGSSG